ncbi:hypothetical protein Acr_00g0032930 [Actinidia rufa]|uniref:Uncharacterized protein n=1 Tax=Actinidia rufa TaxID=165716 RepID=A0A7J0DHF6_9ERIC|nr:hypothetical protein Acr_00g0032930 [Actinidia rufa]
MHMRDGHDSDAHDDGGCDDGECWSSVREQRCCVVGLSSEQGCQIWCGLERQAGAEPEILDLGVETRGDHESNWVSFECDQLPDPKNIGSFNLAPDSDRESFLNSSRW